MVLWFFSVYTVTFLAYSVLVCSVRKSYFLISCSCSKFKDYSSNLDLDFIVSSSSRLAKTTFYRSYLSALLAVTALSSPTVALCTSASTSP